MDTKKKHHKAGVNVNVACAKPSADHGHLTLLQIHWCGIDHLQHSNVYYCHGLIIYSVKSSGLHVASYRSIGQLSKPDYEVSLTDGPRCAVRGEVDESKAWIELSARA